VINLGSILVGNATLVVANVLTCNNHSQFSGHANGRAATCVHSGLQLEVGPHPAFWVSFCRLCTACCTGTTGSAAGWLLQYLGQQVSLLSNQ
jgi:hypothetical protein